MPWYSKGISGKKAPPPPPSAAYVTRNATPAELQDHTQLLLREFHSRETTLRAMVDEELKWKELCIQLNAHNLAIVDQIHLVSNELSAKMEATKKLEKSKKNLEKKLLQRKLELQECVQDLNTVRHALERPIVSRTMEEGVKQRQQRVQVILDESKDVEELLMNVEHIGTELEDNFKRQQHELVPGIKTKGAISGGEAAVNPPPSTRSSKGGTTAPAQHARISLVKNERHYNQKKLTPSAAAKQQAGVATKQHEVHVDPNISPVTYTFSRPLRGKN